MATAELLLLQPIENLGDEGDTVSVKAGYARNYLLPQGVAIPVTRANRKQIESLKTRAAKRRENELEHARELARKLEQVSLAFAVKTGPGGKMFGSVTSQDLVNRLKEEGLEIDKKKINLYNPVKSLGQHTTRIRLHPEISVDVSFEVVSENPIEENEEGEA